MILVGKLKRFFGLPEAFRRRPSLSIGKHQAKSGAARTSEFAQRIARRYHSTLAPLSASRFVLRRVSQDITVQNFYQHRHSHAQIGPCLKLSTAQWAREPNSNRTLYQTIVKLQPDLQVQRQILRQQVLRRETSTLKETSTHVAHYAKQVLLRFQRQESMARISYDTAGTTIHSNFIAPTATPQAKDKPVGTVLHKSTVVANPDAAERNTTVIPKSARRDTQNSRPQTSASPIDVNRLTDEVIQAIDRRILIQRERMGRS